MLTDPEQSATLDAAIDRVMARAVLPLVRSILMDEATLLRHRELWVEEPAQALTVPVLGHTPEEHEVFTGLRENRWVIRLRLEQERIGWEYAWSALLRVK